MNVSTTTRSAGSETPLRCFWTEIRPQFCLLYPSIYGYVWNVVEEEAHVWVEHLVCYLLFYPATSKGHGDCGVAAEAAVVLLLQITLSRPTDITGHSRAPLSPYPVPPA